MHDSPGARSRLAPGVLLALLLGVSTSPTKAQDFADWRVSPKADLSIGLAAGEDAYLFQSIVAVRFMRDGRILVADDGFLNVRIFGSNGRLLATLGGPGRGPGEFQDIDGLWVTSSGRIAVWDGENRRVSRFDSDGEFASTTRVDNAVSEGNLEVFFGRFENDDLLLASLSLGPRTPSPTADPWALLRISSEGKLVRKLGSVRGMRRIDGYPIPFSPMPLVAVLSDSVVALDGYDPEVAWKGSDGRSTRSMWLEVPDPQAGREAWETLGIRLDEAAAHSDFKRRHQLQLQAGRIPSSGRIPSVAALLPDGPGLLWAKLYDPATDPIWLREWVLRPGAGGTWRILSSPTGRVVAQVVVPESMVLHEVGATSVVGVSVDELGVQSVVVHALARR